MTDNVQYSVEQPEQSVDLLKNTPTNNITIDEFSSNSKYSKKSFKIKMITAGLFLISALIFTSGLIIYVETANIHKNDQSDTESSVIEQQSDLLVGLPGQGFLLGSRTSTLWTNKTILQFLGIKYAESPSGIRRFKPPVPKASWTGVLDASQYGIPCPEITNLNATKYGDNFDVEDCLSLNVFTKDRKSKLPVMVYIHGGGFTNGSAVELPPNFLLEKDIILVVMQYRLGVLGFISTQSDLIPGNAAMHDVILALKWVKRYIQFFGGDSNKITIFGQSSGAAMVTLLTVSPVQNHKLFHQVIAQSGSIFAPWAVNQNPINTAKVACEQICKLKFNNCSTISDINECLLNANIKDLLQIKSNEICITLGDLGGILPKLPKQLVNNVKQKYTTFTGFTKHDGSYILSVIYDRWLSHMNGNINSRDLFRLIIENVNDDSSGILNNLLYREIFSSKNQTKQSFSELIPEFIDLCSILYFKSPALTFAQMNSPYDKNKTFVYTFDYEGANTRFGYEKSTEHYPFNGGVHHSDDYMYLFPYYYKTLNENNTEIAKQMVDIWTSFAIKGVPTYNEKLEVPPFNGVGPYLRINTNMTIGIDYSDEFFAAINDPENYKLIKTPKL